jgi:hypothetical protein
VQYIYDSYKRVIQIKRGTLDQYNNFTESTCERETYTYGTNAGTYTLGRLVTVQYTGGLAACNTTFTETYSYNQAGGVLDKSVQVNRQLDQYTNSSFTPGRRLYLRQRGSRDGDSVSFHLERLDVDIRTKARKYLRLHGTVVRKNSIRFRTP